ncbi:expressed unknown protein [Seminavis robusta]|uniref:Uncharacterized protein n=1 Tax=Seminavis robusta TaxID=568900 RepID=A0A9N8DZV5_9STRA|nr:expressed unknown protein [Seminavis robusta]|eukprot:Sro481_g151510.1 n/a (374) ;mRNA; f:13727-15088
MKAVPSLLLFWFLCLFRSTVVAVDDDVAETEYKFSISMPDDNSGRLLRQQRKRRISNAAAPLTQATTTTGAAHQVGKESRPEKKATMTTIRDDRRLKSDSKNKDKTGATVNPMTEEDKLFWDRLLSDEVASILPAETRPPVPCPTRIDVDCMTVDGGNPCTSVVPPANGTGDDCLVEVEFIYTISNDGTETERIYSLQVTRGLESIVITDIPDAIPTVDLPPGDVIVAPVLREIDVCTETGIGAFNTVAKLLTGPPSSISVEITCVSEEGEECQRISQAPTPDDCLLDVIYTYTVENTGVADFNIFEFTRARDGEFANLMPLLDTVFLASDATTAVQEREEIDRCVSQSFFTQVKVRKVPTVDLLCEDRDTYP